MIPAVLFVASPCCLVCPCYLSSTWVIVKLAMKKSDDIELCLRAWKWEAIGKKVKRRICTLAVATTTLLGAELRYEWENMNRLIGPNVSLSPHLMYSFSVRTTLRACGHAKTTPRLMSQNNVRLLNREKLQIAMQKAASAHAKFRERYLDSTTMTGLMRPWARSTPELVLGLCNQAHDI